MLILAAAAAALTTPQAAPRRSPAAALVEARATVRILAGVRLHLGPEGQKDGFVRRDAIIRSAAGAEAATLIEFE